MAWRLHLSDRTIKRLDILSNKPSVLAAWTATNRVSFLDLQNGAPRGDLTIEPVKTTDRSSTTWQTFVQSLSAPNDLFLPTARAPQAAIFLSTDGKTRLYYTGGTDLYLEVDGKEAKIETDAKHRFIAIGMDRASGLVAALDAEAKLHIYKQHVRVGVFDTKLEIDEEFRPVLIVTADGTALFVSDGHCITALNPDGSIRQHLPLHYTVGAINASPNGRRFVTSDLDTNVIRIYDGSLTPTHQRFADDLLTESKRAQLLSSPSTASAALGPLAINNKGVLAFALSGTVCVTSLSKLKAHPKMH